MLYRSLSFLILGAALGAPIWAHADDAYGRVIWVEPSASFDDSGHGPFKVQYELGGQLYWTESSGYPGPWITIHIQPSRADSYRGEHGYDREDHHWWRHHDRDDDDD